MARVESVWNARVARSYITFALSISFAGLSGSTGFGAFGTDFGFRSHPSEACRFFSSDRTLLMSSEANIEMVDASKALFNPAPSISKMYAEGSVLGMFQGAAVFECVNLTLNVLLCAFNLIPLPPLDGASVIGLFIPESAALKMRELSHSPMFQMAGLLIAWRIFPAIVGPLFGMILKAVHPGLGYS